MKELVGILNRASEAYYQKDTEYISNLEYDKLYDELLALEKATGDILPNSPTQKVGYMVVDSLKKVTHDIPMLSLDKTKEIDKLEKFLDEYDALLSFKLDGLTLIVKYENGILKQAITRGDGTSGEDVTHNVKHFSNIPYKIPFKEKLVLRGEAVITYSEFKNINDNLEDEIKYKNPRNLCSGTVRQLDSEIFLKRNVMYFVFSVVEAVGMDFKSLKSEALEWVKNQGFELIEHIKTNKYEVQNHVEIFKNKVLEYDIPTDGLVLTYDNIDYSESLGSTSKFPKDSIAFKWEDEKRETILLDIEWNTSRTGSINPLAIFEPVEIEGSTVSRASLHNLSVAENLKLGIGDTIVVYKSNMIIPQVDSNLTCSDNVIPPTHCSVCEGETSIVEQNNIKMVYCTNPLCKAQQVKSLSHYVSRNAMNIEGMSEATLEKFVEKGFIENYVDIYKLSRFSDEIKTTEGFGEKSYEKIINSIEASKNCKLPNYIYGLGIDNIGVNNAKLLCKHYNYDLEKIKKSEIEDLVSIEGFGLVIAESLHKFFNNPQNIELMNEALNFLEFQNVDTSDNTLEGLNFVITGAIEKFKNRKELKDFIESKGGKVLSGVTSKTSYLINNDKESSSAKNKAAKKLEIPIIDEKEFIEKIYIIES